MMLDEEFGDAGSGAEPDDDRPTGPADLSSPDDVIDRIAREVWSKGGCTVADVRWADKASAHGSSVAMWIDALPREQQEAFAKWFEKAQSGVTPGPMPCRTPDAIVVVDHKQMQGRIDLFEHAVEKVVRVIVDSALGVRFPMMFMANPNEPSRKKRRHAQRAARRNEVSDRGRRPRGR